MSRNEKKSGNQERPEDPGDDLNKQTMALVERARTGDHEAIGLLYQIYEKKVKAAVRDRIGIRLRGKIESMDLIQSVWKDVLSDMNGFEYRGPQSFLRWLYLRLIHKIQDKVRYFGAGKRNIDREKGLSGVVCNGEAIESQARRPAATPSVELMKDESLSRFMMYLDVLPEPQRQALTLRMRDELGFGEIAKIMGKSVDAVRKLYARGLKKVGDSILENKNSPERH